MKKVNCFYFFDSSTMPSHDLFHVHWISDLRHMLRDCCVARLRYSWDTMLRYCYVARLRDCSVGGCVIVVLQGCVFVLLRSRLRDCCVARLRDCAMLIVKTSAT
jgi:hypothetical protein